MMQPVRSTPDSLQRRGRLGEAVLREKLDDEADDIPAVHLDGHVVRFGVPARA